MRTPASSEQDFTHAVLAVIYQHNCSLFTLCVHTWTTHSLLFVLDLDLWLTSLSLRLWRQFLSQRRASCVEFVRFLSGVNSFTLLLLLWLIVELRHSRNVKCEKISWCCQAPLKSPHCRFKLALHKIHRMCFFKFYCFTIRVLPQQIICLFMCITSLRRLL